VRDVDTGGYRMAKPEQHSKAQIKCENTPPQQLGVFMLKIGK